MKIITLIFLFVINISFSQTNQELINSIIKGGSVETDCVGIACQKGKEYLNFQELKSRISEKELIEFSNHKNPILRMYASIDLIQSNKGDVVAMFSRELIKKDTVPMVRGCIIDDLSTASIIYNEYRGKFIFQIYGEDLSANETKRKIDELLNSDFQLKKLDRIILTNENELDWLFYARIFENNTFKESDLKRIEELAFEFNNSYAMFYLKFNYPNLYEERIERYFTSEFKTADFSKKNGVFYLHTFVEYLLDSEIEENIIIAVNKLKADNSWQSEKAWFENTLNNFGVKL